MSRHVTALFFDGARACDRRLRALVDHKYLMRSKVLYGVPYLYQITTLARRLLGLNPRQDKIRIDHIEHDSLVLDALIHFMAHEELPLSAFEMEKELNRKNGFGQRCHQPDFVFIKDGKSTAVEIELTTKAKDRLEANVKSNFMKYDQQIWLIRKDNRKLLALLKSYEPKYASMNILSVEDFTDVNDFIGY